MPPAATLLCPAQPLRVDASLPSIFHRLLTACFVAHTSSRKQLWSNPQVLAHWNSHRQHSCSNSFHYVLSPPFLVEFLRWKLLGHLFYLISDARFSAVVTPSASARHQIYPASCSLSILGDPLTFHEVWRGPLDGIEGTKKWLLCPVWIACSCLPADTSKTANLSADPLSLTMTFPFN